LILFVPLLLLLPVTGRIVGMRSPIALLIPVGWITVSPSLVACLAQLAACFIPLCLGLIGSIAAGVLAAGRGTIALFLDAGVTW